MRRFALPDDGQFTHAEIAEELGVSQQRIQQIERLALRKCRRWCEKRGLCLADLLPLAEDQWGSAARE